MGVPLRTAAAPTGIVGLELAWSGARAVAILDSWGEDGCVAARGSLWVDFAFIPAYVAGLGLLTALAARAWSDPRPVLPAMVGPVAIGPPATGLAVGLIYGLALAGLLDVAENAALSRMLARYDPERTDGGVSDRLAAFAAFCAAVKFALIAVALLYLVGGALLGLGRLR